MSHFTLMAIGEKESIGEYMERYNENREVPLYIYETKQEILDRGALRIKEHNDIINLFEQDPTAAIKKYGEREVTWQCKNPLKFKTAEEYYNSYTSGDILDSEGNVLSKYNPESKWDYFTVEREITVKEIKEKYIKAVKEYDPEHDTLVWNFIVNGGELPQTIKVCGFC